jgi:hypothetical protein
MGLQVSALVAGAALAAGVPSAGVPGPLEGLPLYSAGERVDGLPLTAVLGRDGASPVSFVYGDCQAAGDAGCTPPAEVQVWPGCRRNLALYGREGLPGPALEAATARGVPGAFLDGGTRLELQTGRVTVVIFAESRARVLRIVDVLRALDGSVPPSAPLPPPEPGALEGALVC